MDEKIDVVLPAAGSGQRFGACLPKQFVEVDGKPIISYTIDAFQSINWVDRIVVVITPKWKKEMKKIVEAYKFYKVILVDGDETRHCSIFNGLKMLERKNQDKIVVVHDAVRPFLEEDFLKELVETAVTYKAAGSVRHLVSTTLRMDEDSFMKESLVRSEYCESHTPQAFHYKILIDAYRKCSQYDFVHGTECLNLVQKYCDVQPKLVFGPEYLWKVTHQKDIILMKSYLRQQKSKDRDNFK